MDNLLKRRVEERIRVLRTNAFEVARKAELERNFVNDILIGKKASVRGPNLLKLARALGCSAAWLIDESAPAPRDVSDMPELMGVAEEPANTNLAPDLTADMIAIPEYDVRLSAGPGALVGEEAAIDVWSFSRRYLVDQLQLNPATLAVVEVVGDSMMPTLASGDRVLIDHGDRNPGRGGIFALWDTDATVVKRVERIPASDPAMLVLISDNKNHNQYQVLAEYVNIIGRVVWFARRL
jgi:phage repressor protein C with HTH and peptisase S24 domain